MTDDRIIDIQVLPVEVPLTDPFVVATGSLPAARNLVVRLALGSGVAGYGEIAPFPEVGGTDREACQHAAEAAAPHLRGQPVTEYRRLARRIREAAPRHPAVWCGLETAVLDALTRRLGVPLWAFLGGADVRPRESDVTIPIASLARTVELAREWHARGFRLLKMKVGVDVDDDLRRLEAVHRALPDVTFVADGNQGFDRERAAYFVAAARRAGCELVLMEQPLREDDLEGLAALRRETGVSVAADESVRSLQDLLAVIRAEAADVVNVKIMKSGVLDSLEIASCARAAGLGLMIGGMVETRLAMGCSFGLVLGLGGFEVLDLDTPLLMKEDPIAGGYRYEGPRLLPWTEPGLGVSLKGR